MPPSTLHSSPQLMLLLHFLTLPLSTMHITIGALSLLWFRDLAHASSRTSSVWTVLEAATQLFSGCYLPFTYRSSSNFSQQLARLAVVSFVEEIIRGRLRAVADILGKSDSNVDKIFQGAKMADGSIERKRTYCDDPQQFPDYGEGLMYVEAVSANTVH
ncbi:hypothetical protein C8R45DRAFT_926677 [Mycena sanguinolenta]|nr:hypothetical protein C8R45DRAFT_926677 [Mycena sanguinolenta]